MITLSLCLSFGLDTPAQVQPEASQPAPEQTAAENPYAQADMAQQQPQQQLFDNQQEEEEYKPQEVEANPYAGEQMPMGFGAERANLMGEQAVHMPSQQTTGPSVNGG